MALFDGEKLTFGHVGDSRAYLFRGDSIRQLTKDHTFVQSLIDEGRITDEEARTHPHRNLILKAIDGVHDIDADLFDVELELGDRVLLCSDGASGVLDDGRLADILSMGTPDYAAVELVRASLEAGTTDNVTCLVADIVDEADESVARASSSRCWSAPRPTSSGACTCPACRSSSAAIEPATPASSSRSGPTSPTPSRSRSRPTPSTRRRCATPRGHLAASCSYAASSPGSPSSASSGSPARRPTPGASGSTSSATTTAP